MINKIQSERKIISLVRKLRKQGKTIVTYSGSFDILHAGHVASLKEARSKGDVLIILLNSDASVRAYKGPQRPLIPEKERAEILAAMSSVDFVVLFHDINPIRILSVIKPDIHCNGADWGRHCVEKEMVEKNGGKIIILKWRKGFSTTDILQRIFHAASCRPTRAIFLDRDGTINDNKKRYVHTVQEFQFKPGVIKALKRLSQSEFKIIIITNQSGIGRGYFSIQDLEELHSWMTKTFQSQGVRIDKIYYCPHLPDDQCSCRKPQTGMIMKAVQDFGISLCDSWLIGDSEKDIRAGKESNIKTIQVGEKAKEVIKPHYRVKNLLEVVSLIMPDG